MIRPQLLMSAQQVVASAFVGEGIGVRFDATVPRADLGARIMHLRPMPEEVSDAEMVDIRADCDHELGHFLYTSHDVFSSIKRSMVRLIACSIEDGYIERRHGERYYGAAENLARSNGKQFEAMRVRANSSANSRRGRAITALMILSFGRPEEDVYRELGDDIAGYIAEIRDLIPALATTGSTADSKALAESIADRWRWDQPDESPAAEDDSGGKSSSTTELRQKSKETDDRRLDYGKEDQVAAQLEPELPSNRRKQDISMMGLKRAKVYRARTDQDVVGVVPEPQIDPRGLLPEFMDSVRQVAGPLRRRLLMEFRGVGPVMKRHQNRGRLDHRVLHKIQLDCFNVFSARLPDIVIDRDVTLMVDCSGSMVMESIAFLNNPDLRQYSRLWVASQCACACSMVLDLLGVTHEVLAWTTTGKGRADPAFERVTPLRHMVVKPHNAAFHRCQQNFVKLALFDEPSENIDGEAVLWGAQRLAYRARRAGKRPLMIVFSDGEPLSTPEDPGVLFWHLQQAVRRIELAGIPTLGVGIQTDAVSQFYPRFTVVDELSDLIGAFYKILRKELRQSRKVVPT